MRGAAPTTVILLILIAISVALAGVAATMALADSRGHALRADLTSAIRADYSADPAGMTLAPLGDGILESARQDDHRLSEGGDGVEIVQVFNPGGTPPGYAGLPEPSPAAGATPAPGRSPTPGQTPGQTPAPGETPRPGATPTPQPQPGATPTPGLTPAPRPTATPTPTPTNPLGFPLYLHNNPTPPNGDTLSQEILPLNSAAPTSSVLYNYDTDRDSTPGLMIQQGGTGPSETDPAKHQHWRAPALSVDVPIQGNVVVGLWSAMKEFKPGRGTVSVYLYDYSDSYTLIGAAGLDLPDWQNGNADWQVKSFTMANVSYVLPAGHNLELILVVRSSSDDDMWFAYDTAARKSRIWLAGP